MGKESTAHAKAILTEFLKQCGGAQGAILELKYGHYAKRPTKGPVLSDLKDSLLNVQDRITGVLEELE